MKQKITLIIFLFITFFCHSQKCLSDEFLNIQKNNNPQLNTKIKEVIASFKNKDVSETGKIASTQELMSDEIVVIPVVFNIIHSGEPLGVGKNIPLSKIEEQISLLNQAYSGQYGGIDTKIRFCLAKQNTVGQVTTGVNRFIGNASYDMGIPTSFNLFCVPNSETDWQIKRNISSGFPSNLFLNIWTTDLKYCGKDSLLGFSSFPFDNNPNLDGVVLDYLQVGINGTPNTSNYSNGTTAVHEIGHWLGLFHIFSDVACDETDCETEGDLICDTDAVSTSGIDNIVLGGNCLGYNCKGQTTDVVQNYMDYQISSRMYCQTKFTAGQKRRMRDMLTYYRSSIYSQGALFDFTACKATSYGGGGGGCSEDSTLPVQKINKPNIYQDLSQFSGVNIKFGERFEVNDKWLVTIFNTTANYVTGTPKPTTPVVNNLLIYKREGCNYALHQMIDVGLQSNFDLLMSGNEIIITSGVKDEVYICRLNESTNKWSIVQQIKHELSGSRIGTDAYILGRFLFILESSSAENNIFRVYYKNDIGTYVFHQNIGIPNFNLPSSRKYLQSGNFKQRIINFNSSSFTGSYDPQEILVSKYNGAAFALLELDSNNIWVLSNTSQPMGMSTIEMILDIEMSKDFIYVLTSAQTGPNGSLPDLMYLYTYRITDRTSGSTFPFQSVYYKQELLSYTDGIYFDTKLQVFNDQFFFIDNIKYQPLTLFYNTNFETNNLPNWQKRANKKIACANPIENSDDFEVFGNLLFYGNSENTINIYNVSNILAREGFDQTFIDNSDFYNKKISIVPDNYSTSAQNITIGESNKIEFNYVEKEFIANNSIVLKPGTTLSSGSKVKLKITDAYGLCNSIIASKMTGEQFDFIDSSLNTMESETTNKIQSKVVLSPNPNNGIFTINLQIDEGTIINYDIYDRAGNVVLSNSTDKPTLNVSLPYLPPNIYLIKFSGSNFNETIKFIKQ